MIGRSVGLFIIIAIQVVLAAGHAMADSNDWHYDADRGEYVYAAAVTVEDSRSDPHGIDELPAFVTRITVNPDAPRFRTIPEILSGAVGVTVRDFGGLGALSTVSVRGASAGQTLVLLDGVRLNTAADSGVDLSHISLDDIERIDILRGADSAVFGDGAMGGVINLVTRKPDHGGWSFRARMDAGEYNTWRTNIACMAGRADRDIRLGGYYNRSDGDFPFTNDNGTPDNSGDDFDDVRTNNDMETSGGSLRLRMDLNAAWSLTGNTEGFFSRKGVPGMTAFPSVHAREIDRRISTRWRMQGRVAGSESGLFFLELDGLRTGLNFDDPMGEQTGVPIHTRQRTIAFGGRVGWIGAMNRHTASVTGEMRRESLADDDFDDPTRRTVSIFTKDDFEIVRDRFWITGAARYDDVSDTSGRVSPKLGVKWFITPSLALKTNAGAGYRSPSFNELYMNMGYITGNPDLKPEKNRSYDLGITWEVSRFRLETALFQTDAEDLIQYVLVSGFRYKPYNIGKARSRGVETDLGWNPWRRLHLTVSYTYMEAVDRSDNRNTRNKQIPGRPEHQLFSRLEWSGDRLTVTGEWRYMSGNFVTSANTKELPDRRTGNVGIQYRLTKTVSLGAEVKNITDSRVVDIRGFPLPPRTFFGSLRVTL